MVTLEKSSAGHFCLKKSHRKEKKHNLIPRVTFIICTINRYGDTYIVPNAIHYYGDTKPRQYKCYGESDIKPTTATTLVTFTLYPALHTIIMIPTLHITMMQPTLYPISYTNKVTYYTQYCTPL